MKFRISSRDLIILLAFAAILLYLCAIATTNIHYFSLNGSFYGLNPIPGFTKFLGATLLLFAVMLAIIITSVSSKVFEQKKGFGLEIGEKENKGYSRWAKDKEIKTDSDIEEVDPLQADSSYAGIPLVNDGKKLWVDNGYYHNLVIGATGSGKSQTIVEPMVELLAKKGESMIITDPKGELYTAAGEYLKQRGYNIIVLNFRDPQNGNAWNPLTLPHQYYKDGNVDKATELIDDVALNILYDPNNKGEPFWEKSSADYFSGLTLGLFEDAKEDEINLNSVNFMSTMGEEKFAASDYIREYFKMKGESSNAYVFASSTINAPVDTKGGILSVFRQKIRLFSTRENLSEMLSYSDFDMREIGREKTAVFIVIHDEKTTYHSLATIFIKQCYETLIDIAQKNGGKLPFRTNFILDEFSNMPPLKDVTTMVTAARSRDMRFTFIIQNFAQLKQVYGNDNAETIKGNCGNLVYLISTELAALEEISKMCGEVKSDEKDKTASTPLVTVTDLQKLKLFEAIIIRWRKPPFKTKYTPNFKMDWGHEHVEASFPLRDKKAVKLFDIKSFVKEKKRQNMLNSLENGGSDLKDPFAPKDPFSSKNPFAPKDPFASQSSFGGTSPSGNSGLFGGLGGGLDLDAMMKDIDRKIAELDAEEARQKEEMERKKKEALTEKVPSSIKEVNPVSKGALPLEKEAVPVLPALDDLPFKKEKETQERKEQLNIYDTISTSVSSPNLTDLKQGEISMGHEKANIAVATSSPVDDNEFEFENLPKVENASIIQPNYISGTTIKPNDTPDFNIYNTVPNLMDKVKEEKEPVSSNAISVSDEEIAHISKKLETPVAEEKANVKIDPDKVVIDHNVISDDEFFDDFFGDD